MLAWIFNGLITATSFALVLGLLVFIHETWALFRRTFFLGVAVERFSVGFW